MKPKQNYRSNRNSRMLLDIFVVATCPSHTEVQRIATNLVRGAYLDRSLHTDLVDMVYRSEVDLNERPGTPVYKMSQKRWVDEFFRNGSLFLETPEHYRQFDHEEVGDKTEGQFLLVGQRESSTYFANAVGGFNTHLFCCYAGEPDETCIQRFGYDASYEVCDVESFAKAVKRKIKALDYNYARCVYSNDKVIIGNLPKDFRSDEISADTLSMIDEAKFFVKPVTYSHQTEFRFAWTMRSTVTETPIRCPEAVQFCRKV